MMVLNQVERKLKGKEKVFRVKTCHSKIKFASKC